MAGFPDALRTALAETGWSMSEVARRDGAKQSSISRYLTGDERPGISQFARLVSIFPARLQEEMTAAYLAEQIPEAVGKRVQVSLVREDEGGALPVLPDQPIPGSHNDRVIKTLAKHIMIDPNLAIVLDYLASAKDGRMPVSNQTGEDLTVLTVEERARLEEADKALSADEARRAAKKKPVRYGRQPKG